MALEELGSAVAKYFVQFSLVSCVHLSERMQEIKTPCSDPKSPIAYLRKIRFLSHNITWVIGM